MNRRSQLAKSEVASWSPALKRMRHLLAFLPAISWCLLRAQAPAELETARNAMQAGQYAAAEQDYRKALAHQPSSAILLTDLGLSLQMQRRSEEAMHFYSLALKQEYVPETYALLAEEKCRMGDLDAMRPMLTRIFIEQRQNLRVLSAVAPCYLDIDEPVESAIVYQALLGGDYPADLALVQLAKSYIRSGQFFAGKLSKMPAGEPFLAALRQAPTAGDAGARSAFPQAAKISPYFSPALTWTETVERWRKHPQDPALLYLGSVLSAEEGMRQIEICEQRFPGSPYLEQFQADVLADQGHEDEAAAAYEELMRQHPDLSDLRYSLGLLREKQQQWEAAAQAFRQQLDAYPSDERAEAHLSRCLLAMEQYAAVRDLLEPRMKEEHPPQWASLNLAQAEQKLGHPDAAISILVAAEKQPDTDKLVHYRLMQLYSMAERPADAKREFALFQAASKP
jgi:tetratricopeptide (TPR) repeat protein